MMKILVLGGIAESRALALALIESGHQVIYSIAGLVRQPDLPCSIHSGGFSDEHNDGARGMARYCRANRIDLLIDSTHPYAVNISGNAVAAAADAAIPCWRFDRPGWNRNDHPGWHDYRQWPDLLPQIESFRRPFFSIGTSALRFADQRPPHQQWLVRSARPFDPVEGIIQVNAIGPFDLTEELDLMRRYRVDALISKNSGCSRVAAKLEAAARLGLPVYVQERPDLPPVAHCFHEIASLIAAIPR